MTPSTFLALGLGSGIFSLIAYIFFKVRADAKPALADGVVLILSSCGAVAGFRNCMVTFDQAVLASFAVDPISIFLGGLAIIWVSVETLFRILKGARQSP